jgi:hypothetical protein
MSIALEEGRRGVKTINHQQSGAIFDQHEYVHMENNGTNMTTNC